MQALPMLGTAETRLDQQSALMLAEQVLAEPRGLMFTFGSSKMVAEVTQRHAGGFTYRSYLKAPLFRIRANDGYVTVQDNGQGGTRVSFHENKRYLMLWGPITAGVFLLMVLLYFLVIREGEPRTLAERLEHLQRQQAGGGGDWAGIGFLIGLVIGTIFAALQFAEIAAAPKKVVELFNQRQMHGPGYHPGMAGQPQHGFHPGAPGHPQQPGFQPGAQGQPPFPGQPQPGMGGQAPHQPQGGGFPPHQPQGGFPPAPPQGFAPAQPQPQPQGFPPPPQGQGGFPPPPQGGFPPAPGGHPPAQPGAAAAADPEAKLRELAQLRDSGVISAADFEQAKAALEAKWVG